MERKSTRRSTIRESAPYEDVNLTDDKSGFFAKGRDYESRYVNHSYTAQEREILAGYESLDYLPPHSHVYKNWLRQQPAR